MFTSFQKQPRFQALADSARHCTLCERMCSRTRVLSDANGNLDARVLFVAEAPGRLGADRTGIPLFGDRTGDNFESLLANVGWRRDQLFITNAVLCNPREENGTNGTPTTAEVLNCSRYLKMTIDLVSPEVVVTLGATALRALEFISSHRITLREGVGRAVPWAGRLLFPLYHPGPRALIHRGLAKQRQDFFTLAGIVDPDTGVKERRGAPMAKEFETPSALHQLVKMIVDQVGELTFFKLTKMLYLIDYAAKQAFGATVSGQVYLRQQEGPWIPKLHAIVRSMEGFEVRSTFVRRTPHVEPGPSPRFAVTLDGAVLRLATDTIAKYGQHTNSEIKSAVYFTRPMRELLREERTGKRTKGRVVI